jgi:hypothetical protein
MSSYLGRVWRKVLGTFGQVGRWQSSVRVEAGSMRSNSRPSSVQAVSYMHLYLVTNSLKVASSSTIYGSFSASSNSSSILKLSSPPLNCSMSFCLFALLSFAAPLSASKP